MGALWKGIGTIILGLARDGTSGRLINERKNTIVFLNLLSAQKVNEKIVGSSQIQFQFSNRDETFPLISRYEFILKIKEGIKM